MPGLERGVLAVVGEAEQLPRRRPADRRRAAARGRRTGRGRSSTCCARRHPASSACRSRPLPRAVRDAAAQAEPERRRDEMAGQAGRRRLPPPLASVIGRGSRVAQARLDEPVAGSSQSAGTRLRTLWLIAARATGPSRRSRRSRSRRPRRRCRSRSPAARRPAALISLAQANRNVLLPALAAERERHQQLLAIAGNVQLPGRADVPLSLRRQARPRPRCRR